MAKARQVAKKSVRVLFEQGARTALSCSYRIFNARISPVWDQSDLLLLFVCVVFVLCLDVALDFIFFVLHCHCKSCQGSCTDPVVTVYGDPVFRLLLFKQYLYCLNNKTFIIIMIETVFPLTQIGQPLNLQNGFE